MAHLRPQLVSSSSGGEAVKSGGGTAGDGKDGPVKAGENVRFYDVQMQQREAAASVDLLHFLGGIIGGGRRRNFRGGIHLVVVVAMIGNLIWVAGRLRGECEWW